MAQLLEAHNGVQVDLAKIRAEGDWFVIKIEMEHKEMQSTLKAIEGLKKYIQEQHDAKIHVDEPQTYEIPCRV